MAIVALRTSDNGGGSVNYGYQVETSLFVSLGFFSMVSTDVASTRRWIAMRFPSTPLDLTPDNLRQVRLEICGNNNNYNDAMGTLYGHLHPNSGPLASNAFGDPNKDIVARPRTTAHIKWNGVDTAPYYAFVFPEGPGPDTLFDIIHEIISLPTFTPGNPITLIVKPDEVLPLYRWEGYGGAAKENQPILTLNYGDSSSDPVNIDLYGVGDSTIAYTFNSGFDRGSLQLPLLPNINFYHAAAGMGPDQGYNALNSGDRVRGYCDGGIYSRELDRRYGDELLMYVHQHAIADTLAAQWVYALQDPGEYFWGDINQVGTLRYNLANPKTDNQVVIFNLGPNDVIGYGANHFVHGHGALDPEVNHAQWADAVQNIIQPNVETVTEEIYRCVEEGGNDPTNCWIFITGYPNHCVIDKVMTNPNGTTFLPTGMSNQIFRAIWCMGDGNHNQLGFLQYAYDTGIPPTLSGNHDRSLHPDPFGGYHRDYQSSLIFFAIDRQQKAAPNDCPENDGDPAHKWGPNEYNPAAGPPNYSWDAAILNVNFPTLSFLSYTPWTYNWGNPSVGGSRSMSGWYYGYRNVTDITINRKMALLDEMNQRIADAHPQIAFANCRNKMEVDTWASADPTSRFAQPRAENFVEGVHLNDTGTTRWLNWPGGILDTLVRTIPVMQRLESPFEHVEEGATVGVTLQGEWNGTDVDFAYFDREYVG